MKDHSKKLNDLKENSNAIFIEAIGLRNPFYKKEEPQYGIGQIEKIDTGQYRMGNSLITGIQGVSDSEILNYDWKNSSLDWLLDCVFEGILVLDLDKGILKSFGGVWKKGVFKGLAFSNHSTASFGLKGQSGQVQFGDETVSPRYVPAYNTWNASVLDFFDGTIDRETGGILGMQDAVNGAVNKKINILTLTPGKSLNISVRSKVPVRGAGGKMQAAPVSAVHKIVMVKRIDSRSSDITLEVTNGETGQASIKNFPWSEFKKAGIGSMTFQPNVNQSFFGLDLKDKSVSAEIMDSGKDTLSHSPTSDDETNKKLAKTQQTFDLKSIPYLNLDKPAPGAAGKITSGMKDTEAYFYSPTSDYLNKFNEVKKGIESGTFQSDINLIASGVKNGLIKGYYDNPSLANMFNDVKGGESAYKDYIMPLRRLGDFMVYFVDRIYIQGDNTKPDEKTQDLIKTKLKKVLGIDSYIKAVAPAAAPATAPAAAKKPQGKFNMKEDIVKAIKNIIS
jgi:hypothetical protein